MKSVSIIQLKKQYTWMLKLRVSSGVSWPSIHKISSEFHFWHQVQSVHQSRQNLESFGFKAQMQYTSTLWEALKLLTSQLENLFTAEQMDCKINERLLWVAPATGCNLSSWSYSFDHSTTKDRLFYNISRGLNVNKPHTIILFCSMILFRNRDGRKCYEDNDDNDDDTKEK